MTRFFFDLSTPAGFERDAVGIEFASLERAYLEASRAAIDISADLMRERKDPSRYSFELRDVSGDLVLELPFSEVLQPGRTVKPRAASPAHALLQASLVRNQRLRLELTAVLEQARANVQRALDLAGIDRAASETLGPAHPLRAV